MRGILLKGFFRCRALSTVPNAWARKRRCSSFPLPHVNKRQKLMLEDEVEQEEEDAEKVEKEEEVEEVEEEEDAEEVEDEEDEAEEIEEEEVEVEDEEEETEEVEEEEESEAEEEDAEEEEEVEESDGGSEELPECLRKPTGAQGREKPSLYPSVECEGNVATVKLGVGQMVTLDGCAMVQVVEGQASMLGYSLRQGTDVLVCSSSKLAEVITIEARPVSEEGDLQDVLGCRLRFSSHSLGQNTFTSNVVSGRTLSFKLEFVGPLGNRIRDRDSCNMNESESDDDELELDSEASYSDSEDGDEKDDQIDVPLEDELAATPEVGKKRKGCGRSSPGMKKQKVAESVESFTSIPLDWEEAVETIAQSSSAPVIAICGAKNVGKSTFARFLVNSLLNRYKEVAYLDTDVGQPEFTAPGCVSLHVLDAPVVGPPAMHLRTPERCFFYGDVSPKSNPMMYVEHVADLFSYFRQNHSINSIPLVINTHGWVKGIGYDVIVDILNATSPTHVVQLLANSEKKNLPRDKFWDENSPAVTINVESAVEKLPMHKSARSALHLRATRLLAYFQQCFGENTAPFPYREAKLFAQTAMSLVRDVPYEVPFTALKIKHLHSEVPPSQSLRCVNASIVGLGVTSINKDTKNNDGSPFPLCLGLGIVKAVDTKREVIYVSTPVPQDQLQQVNTLLQGRVEIPVPLLMARGYRCPYLAPKSQFVEGVGAGAMKSKRKPSTKKVL